MKDVLLPLAKSILIPLGLSIAKSVTHCYLKESLQRSNHNIINLKQINGRYYENR